MTEFPDAASGEILLRVHLLERPIYAGVALGLRAEATCLPVDDLTSLPVSIETADGAAIATAVLVSFDGTTSTSERISVLGPSSVGTHQWLARMPAFETVDGSFPVAVQPLAIVVEAHPVVMSVWGLPAAASSGSVVTAFVGVRCRCGCDLGGRTISIREASGPVIAESRLETSVWRSTEALYFTQIALQVSGKAGSQPWEVEFGAAGLELPHADGYARFVVRVVPSARHRVTIEAFDRDAQMPLAGAIVSMHPFRASTDAEGRAELLVPRGAYRVFVTARNYLSDRADITVRGDIATRAELARELRPERI